MLFSVFLYIYSCYLPKLGTKDVFYLNFTKISLKIISVGKKCHIDHVVTRVDWMSCCVALIKPLLYTLHHKIETFLPLWLKECRHISLY